MKITERYEHFGGTLGIIMTLTDEDSGHMVNGTGFDLKQLRNKLKKELKILNNSDVDPAELGAIQFAYLSNYLMSSENVSDEIKDALSAWIENALENGTNEEEDEKIRTMLMESARMAMKTNTERTH